MKEKVIEGKRWTGADWGDQQKEIMIVGQGGIGSWLTLALSRNDHTIYTVDMDTVDQTNVTGGQMFRSTDVGRSKVAAVSEICKLFGCTNKIWPFEAEYHRDLGIMPITMCGLDNMKARRLVFETWKDHPSRTPEEALFIDGRLTLEMYEIFCIQGDRIDQMEEYLEKHLFTDEQAQELDCTTKQSTFAAMGIASMMTATFCNWLTNKKLGMDFRTVPFYQRFHLPIFLNTQSEVEVKEEVV